MVQRHRWDTYRGPKKVIFLIRDIDAPAMAAAPVESCQFVVLRSPWGRLGSVRDVGKRLHRMRGRFHGGCISVQVPSSARTCTMIPPQNARSAVCGPDAAAPRDADDRRLLREVLTIYGREALRSRQRDASYLRRSRQACRGALRGA